MLLISDSFWTNALGTILISLFTFFVYTKWWAHTYWTRKDIPQIQPTFLLGLVYDTLKNKENVGMTFAKLHDKIKEKGLKYCGVYLFLKPMLIVSDLELIKNILVKDFDHFEDRDFYKNEKDDPLSSHLLTQDGEKWKNMRKKLTPTFTSGQLKWMFDILLECNRYVPNILDKHIDSDPVNIKQIFERITMDTIGNCAFGINCNSFVNEDAEFVKYGKKAMDPGARQIFFLIVLNLIPYNTLNRLGMRITSKDVEHFFMGVVRETVKLREEKTVYRKDFMQLLVEIREKDGLTVEDIAAQAFLFFLAAFDTTANSLAFAMAEISRNLEIQDRLREEILNVLEKYDGKITYDAIKEMEYLNCVLEETLRKYCPVSFLLRKCTKDYTIPNTNHLVKKGLSVVISTFAIQQDPEYFTDPQVFDPERFSEANRRKIPQMAYVPFGAGPRNCIGARNQGEDIFDAEPDAVIGYIASYICDSYDITPHLVQHQRDQTERALPVRMNYSDQGTDP
ncbi:cytochrome p450, partial [Rhyzopertha dominica]